MNDFLELTQGLIEKNDFEEPEFQPLPAGEYRTKVVNVEKKTSQSGNDYVAMVLAVIDGDYTGRKIYNNYFLYIVRNYSDNNNEELQIYRNDSLVTLLKLSEELKKLSGLLVLYPSLKQKRKQIYMFLYGPLLR